MIYKENKLVCSVCGSEDIEVKGWFNPNFLNINTTCVNFDISEEEDCYCNNCCLNRPLVLKSEQNEKIEENI